PKLEVPPITRRSMTGLAIFVIALVAIGWIIWASPGTSVEAFAMLGIGIPILFVLKSRWVTIIGLLSFQVIVAFVFMGNSLYALYAVFGVVGVIVAFEASAIIYMLFVAAIWFSSVTSFTTSPLILQSVAGGALIVGWIFRQLSTRKSIAKSLYFPDRWIPIILVSWAAFGVLIWSVNPADSGWLQLKMLGSGVLFFLLSPLILESERQLTLGLWAWIIAAFIAAFSTPVSIGPFSIITDEMSTEAAMAAKNVTAAFLSYSIFLVIAFYYYAKNIYAKMGLILICTFLAIVIFSLYSRAATASAAIAFALYLLLDMFVVSRNKQPLKIIAKLFFFVSLGIILLLSVYFLGLDEMIGSYSDLFYGVGGSSSWEFRLLAWGVARDMILGEGHIIRGLGLGAFWELGPSYGFTVTTLEEDMALFSPHSLFLDILLHYGLVGLILFLTLIYQNMRRLWMIFANCENEKLRYIALGLFCGLFAFYLHNVIDAQLYNITDYWMYLGLSAALINIAERYNSHLNPNSS
ncbi:hypothetical protein KJ564_15665, partial [bacterium]|nr:hypothetical protein [bacterium]